MRGAFGNASAEDVAASGAFSWVHAEEGSPPILETGPLIEVPVVVVAGADVRIGRAQMTVEKYDGKGRRAIVDIDIRAPAIEGDRDLDRRDAPLFAVVRRISLVEHGIVLGCA